jgi:hypothetical protein
VQAVAVAVLELHHREFKMDSMVRVYDSLHRKGFTSQRN